jgi:hypothetical protein
LVRSLREGRHARLGDSVVPHKIFVQALAFVALTAGTAHAQWFPYPYPGPIFGYPQGRSAASVRTQVTPRETQVFVDGYAAGVVDDFDGVFQRLQLVPGQHEISLYLSGYRTYRENVYLNPGSSHNIRHTMAQRAAGEADEALPVPIIPPMAGRGAPRAPAVPPGQGASGYGTLSLRVQPGDASVLVDGEAWHGSQSQERIALQLGDGRHHVQIEKAGFQRFSADVDVRAGETSTLNVSLVAQ